MYEEFYGFRVRPFSILPDSDFLYRSRGHRLALSLLEYGLNAQTGFTVITGEIGSGKTTLVQYLLKNASSDHTIGHITNTGELNKDLMKWVLLAFDIRRSSEQDVDLYQQFVAFVRKRYSEGKDCVLVIDEAQHLNAETLEALRLLSNINTGKDHLLKMLLVGQPELQKTLARPGLVQFAQRISASYHLKPLSLLETREYIATRLKIAGGSDLLFDRLACDLIFIMSGGIPRQTNMLCDTSLVYGYADNQRHISLDTVIAVLRDRVSSQSAAAIPVPTELDRPSIENLIREVREKEFAREAESGIPDSKGQSPSAHRAAADWHAADPGNGQPVTDPPEVRSDLASAAWSDKRDEASDRYGHESAAQVDIKGQSANAPTSTMPPSPSALGVLTAKANVPDRSAYQRLEETEKQLSIFDMRSRAEIQRLDQAVKSQVRREEGLATSSRPFRIYPAEEGSLPRSEKFDLERTTTRTGKETGESQRQWLSPWTARILTVALIAAVFVLFLYLK